MIGVNVPLYQTKAEFLRMLGRPVRIQVLAGGEAPELMGAARRILSDLLSSRRELLEKLREGEVSP